MKYVNERSVLAVIILLSSIRAINDYTGNYIWFVVDGVFIVISAFVLKEQFNVYMKNKISE